MSRRKRGRTGKKTGVRGCSVCGEHQTSHLFTNREWSRPAHLRCCKDCAAAVEYGTPTARALANKLLADVFTLHDALSVYETAQAVAAKLMALAGNPVLPQHALVLLSCGHFAMWHDLQLNNGRCRLGCPIVSPTCSSSPMGARAADEFHKNRLSDSEAAQIRATLVAADGAQALLDELDGLFMAPRSRILLNHFMFGQHPRQAREDMVKFIDGGMVSNTNDLSPYGVMVVFQRTSAWLEGETVTSVSAKATLPESECALASIYPKRVRASLASLLACCQDARAAALKSTLATSMFCSETRDFISVMFDYTHLAASPPPLYADPASRIVKIPADVSLRNVWFIMMGTFVFDAAVRVPPKVLTDWAGSLNHALALVHVELNPSAQTSTPDAGEDAIGWAPVANPSQLTLGEASTRLRSEPEVIVVESPRINRRPLVFSHTGFGAHTNATATLTLFFTPNELDAIASTAPASSSS